MAAYAATADNKLDRLVAHPAGKVLNQQIKAWRKKFFVFMTDREVPATNNISEREIRRRLIGSPTANHVSNYRAQPQVPL